MWICDCCYWNTDLDVIVNDRCSQCHHTRRHRHSSFWCQKEENLTIWPHSLWNLQRFDQMFNHSLFPHFQHCIWTIHMQLVRASNFTCAPVQSFVFRCSSAVENTFGSFYFANTLFVSIVGSLAGTSSKKLKPLKFSIGGWWPTFTQCALHIQWIVHLNDYTLCR